MRKMLRVVAAVLLVAAIAVVVLAFRAHRNGYGLIRSAYTSAVEYHDIADTARNAFSSLTDAEIRAENYVLTGETVYSEAFREDVRTWETESGTLSVIAETGPAAVAARDFLKAGKRTVDELDALVALYEKGGRDLSIARIGKSAAIVYLDQSRQRLTGILDMVGGGAAVEGTTPVMNRGLRSTGLQWEYTFALFCIAFAASILLIVDRRVRSGAK